MTWSWTYLRAAGGTGEDRSQEFPTQADAETWIGESWRDLLESGVDSVVLMEHERVVYGPMALRPA